MISLAVYRDHLQQLFTDLERATAVLEEAGVSYRLVGGLAVFFHVDACDPMAARFTPDIDIAVYRQDIELARSTLALLELRSSVQLLCIEYIKPVPNSPAVRNLAHGIALAPIIDLLQMKLTSFREKDRVHVRDMDSVGLITPEIEAHLSPALQARLQQVRATE